MFVQIVFESVPASAYSDHYVVAQNADKHDVFRVPYSILSFAYFVNEKLFLACTFARNGANVLVQVVALLVVVLDERGQKSRVIVLHGKVGRLGAVDFVASTLGLVLIDIVIVDYR